MVFQHSQGILFVGSVSIYASSGIVNYTSFYGDGSNLSGVTASYWWNTWFCDKLALVGYGVTFLKFVRLVYQLSQLHTVVLRNTDHCWWWWRWISQYRYWYNSRRWLSQPIQLCNLWYHTELGRLFIYYNDGSSVQWG